MLIFSYNCENYNSLCSLITRLSSFVLLNRDWVFLKGKKTQQNKTEKDNNYLIDTEKKTGRSEPKGTKDRR